MRPKHDTPCLGLPLLDSSSSAVIGAGVQNGVGLIVVAVAVPEAAVAVFTAGGENAKGMTRCIVAL